MANDSVRKIHFVIKQKSVESESESNITTDSQMLRKAREKKHPQKRILNEIQVIFTITMGESTH